VSCHVSNDVSYLSFGLSTAFHPPAHIPDMHRCMRLVDQPKSSAILRRLTHDMTLVSCPRNTFHNFCRFMIHRVMGVSFQFHHHLSRGRGTTPYFCILWSSPTNNVPTVTGIPCACPPDAVLFGSDYWLRCLLGGVTEKRPPCSLWICVAGTNDSGQFWDTTLDLIHKIFHYRSFSDDLKHEMLISCSVYVCFRI
jgi:hypothetical protein